MRISKRTVPDQYHHLATLKCMLLWNMDIEQTKVLILKIGSVPSIHFWTAHSALSHIHNA